MAHLSRPHIIFHRAIKPRNTPPRHSVPMGPRPRAAVTTSRRIGGSVFSPMGVGSGLCWLGVAQVGVGSGQWLGVAEMGVLKHRCCCWRLAARMRLRSGLRSLQVIPPIVYMRVKPNPKMNACVGHLPFYGLFGP